MTGIRLVDETLICQGHDPVQDAHPFDISVFANAAADFELEGMA